MALYPVPRPRQQPGRTAVDSRLYLPEVTVPTTPVDGDPLELLWDTNSEVTGDALDLKWDLVAEVTGDALDLKWDLNSEVTGDSLDLKWDTAAEVTGDSLDLKWDLAAEVTGDSLDLKWDTAAAVTGDALDLLWDVRNEVTGDALDLLWDLRSEVTGDALDLKWDLAAATGVVHRAFDGVGHLGSGTNNVNNLTGAFTAAAVVRQTTSGTAVFIWLHSTSGFASTVNMSLGTTGLLRVAAAGTTRQAPTLSLVVADGWGIVAVSKAAGTATPRFHLYKAGAWSHENAPGTVGDAATHSGGYLLVGSSVLVEYQFDLAVLGEWDSALSDGDIETLDWASQNWADLDPLALWNFDQTVTTDTIPDLIGAVDLTGDAGVPIGTDGPASWVYAVAVPVDGDPLELLWDTRSEVTGDALDLIWDVRNEVTGDALDLKWDTNAQVDGTPLDLLWDVRAEVTGDSLDLKWDLNAAVDGASLDLVWDLLVAGVPVDGDPLDLLWDTRAEVTADALDLKWDLAAAVDGSPLDLLWDLPVEVTGTALDLLWDLRVEVNGAALELIWDLDAEAAAVNGPVLTLRWRLDAELAPLTVTIPARPLPVGAEVAAYLDRQVRQWADTQERNGTGPPGDPVETQTMTEDGATFEQLAWDTDYLFVASELKQVRTYRPMKPFKEVTEWITVGRRT